MKGMLKLLLRMGHCHSCKGTTCVVGNGEKRKTKRKKGGKTQPKTNDEIVGFTTDVQPNCKLKQIWSMHNQGPKGLGSDACHACLMLQT